MIDERIGQELSAFPIGDVNPVSQYFSGDTYLAVLSTEQVPTINVTFAPGCDVEKEGQAGFNQAEYAARSASAVVIENAATITDSMNARVYRQEPAYYGPGARASLGGKIDIWLKAESRTETEIGESINLDE